MFEFNQSNNFTHELFTTLINQFLFPQFLETMADVVKQGIIKANEDLEKENQEKLIQEVRNSLITHIASMFVYFLPQCRNITFVTKNIPC